MSDLIRSMCFIDCLNLLTLCVKNEILNCKDDLILICRKKDSKEDYVWEEISDVAQELMYDEEGQHILIEELKKKDIIFEEKYHYLLEK